MTIRNGKMEDITEIMNVIKEAVKVMHSRGVYQWDDIYPNEEVIRGDINENTIYVSEGEEGTIKGIIVLNEQQDVAYETIEWKYNAGKHLIIHRLCIHPIFQEKGIAKTLMNFAEEFGEKEKYQSIRLDAFIPNVTACKMYKHFGYERRGIVAFKKGNFYCYEKEILINKDKF